MDYIVAVEYRLKGEKKTIEDYKKFGTLDEARKQVALWMWIKVSKPDCDLFDVRIYEITNY